jgi:hypothetical protein
MLLTDSKSVYYFMNMSSMFLHKNHTATVSVKCDLTFEDKFTSDPRLYEHNKFGYLIIRSESHFLSVLLLCLQSVYSNMLLACVITEQRIRFIITECNIFTSGIVKKNMWLCDIC